MTNILVSRVDIFELNENGTIDVMTSTAFLNEYPLTFQYKLYLTFGENEKNFLKMIFGDISVQYSYSANLQKYFENRRALYDEVSRKYYPLVFQIMTSSFSERAKNDIIRTIDLELNRLYPYEG